MAKKANMPNENKQAADMTENIMDISVLQHEFCCYCGEQGCDCTDKDGNPAHAKCMVDDAAKAAEIIAEEAPVVSENREDASQNTTESSTNAEGDKDAKTADGIKEKEVDYSAVEALLNQFKGGIIMSINDMIVKVAERKAIHAGTHRYEEMRTLGQVKDPELFGAMIKWHGKHRKHSTGLKMASVRSLTLTPSNAVSNGFSVTALLKPKQSNDMNKHLIVENVNVRSMTGMAALKRKRYMRNALTIDTSGIASKPDIAELMATASWAIDYTENTVEIYMQPVALACIEDEDGRYHTTAMYGAWMHITGKLVYGINDDGTKEKKPHFPTVDDIPETAEVFEGWSNSATVSEKRQGRIPLYAMTYEEYADLQNKVTNGEYFKRLNGQQLSVKDGANLVARISSHHTATINGITIDCLAILNMKREDNDGAVLYNAAFWPEQEGKFGQKRPLTLKCAGTYIPAEAFALLMEMYNWKFFTREELQKNKTLENELDSILNPTLKGETEYNGAVICDNVLQVPQIIATLDGCKDVWDYQQTDNERALKESEDVEKMQHLSGQMFRKLAAAGAMAGKMEEAMELAADIMREDILNLFKEFEAEKEKDNTFRFGTNMSEQQVAVIARRIGTDLKHYPYLYRRAIEDFLRTLSKKILLGAYELPGFYSLVQPDFCTWLPKNAHRVLHIDRDEETGKTYVEVYAPGCEGRAVLFKYPCVGNHEFILIKFVSLEEILKRIDELEDISDKEREFLKLTYKSLKAGTLTIAAYAIVAKVLAGFDYDGDEAMVITHARFVTFFWQNATSIAVDIQPDAVKMGNVIADKWLSAWMQKANAALGNASVGAVTNMGAIFSNLEIMLWANSMTEKQKAVMRSLLCVLGNQVALGLTDKGDDEYVSPISVAHVNGFETYSVTNGAVAAVLKQVRTMHPSVRNLKKFFADMDKIFRFWQELTIDSVKKIFKVVIPFKTPLAEAGIAITSTRHALEFDMQLDESYKIKDIVLTDPAIIADTCGPQLGDVMYLIRKEAVALVMSQMEPIVRDYNNAIATLLQKRVLKQQEYKNNDDQLFFGVNVMGRYVRAMNDYNAYRTHQIIQSVDWDNLGHKTQNAFMSEVNASMKYEMKDMYAAVSNTLRRMAKSIDASTYDIAERMSMVTVGDGAIGQLCSEEIKTYFLDKEDAIYKARIRLIDESAEALVSDYVIVTNGIARSSGGDVGYCSAPNGIYSVRDINGKLYAVQYVSEDIEIPEVDNTQAVVLIEGNSNVSTALQSFRDNGRNVGFALTKTSNGNDAIRMYDENGKPCAWIVANSASAQAGWLPMSQLLADILDGKMFRCETIVHVPGTSKKQRQLLLILEENGKFDLPQKEEEKKAKAATVKPSDSDAAMEADMMMQADQAIAALL